MNNSKNIFNIALTTSLIVLLLFVIIGIVFFIYNYFNTEYSDEPFIEGITTANRFRIKRIIANAALFDGDKMQNIIVMNIRDSFYSPFINYPNNTDTQKIQNLTKIINVEDILDFKITNSEKTQLLKKLNIFYVNLMINSGNNDENIQNIIFCRKCFRTIFNPSKNPMKKMDDLEKIRNNIVKKVSNNIYSFINALINNYHHGNAIYRNQIKHIKNIKDKKKRDRLLKNITQNVKPPQARAELIINNLKALLDPVLKEIR